MPRHDGTVEGYHFILEHATLLTLVKWLLELLGFS